MTYNDYYKWIAVLDDGTIIEQTKPSAIKFTDTDPLYNRIKQFILTKSLADDTYLNNISLTLSKDEKLKFFKRNVVNSKTNMSFTIYIIGTIGGQCSYVFPDGHVELTTGDDPTYIQDFINIYNI